MPDIIHQLTIAASPQDVYWALTQPDRLAHWWTRDVRGKSEVGSILEFGFNERGTVLQMEVTELVVDQHVGWHCLGNSPEWVNTNITFDLSQDNDGAVVRFAHRDWKSTEGIFGVCSYDWAQYLRSLKVYLETGSGHPHPG